MTTMYFSNHMNSVAVAQHCSLLNLQSSQYQYFSCCFVLFHVTLRSDLYSNLGSNELFHFYSTSIQLNLVKIYIV